MASAIDAVQRRDYDNECTNEGTRTLERSVQFLKSNDEVWKFVLKPQDPQCDLQVLTNKLYMERAGTMSISLLARSNSVFDGAIISDTLLVPVATIGGVAIGVAVEGESRYPVQEYAQNLYELLLQTRDPKAKRCVEFTLGRYAYRHETGELLTYSFLASGESDETFRMVSQTAVALGVASPPSQTALRRSRGRLRWGAPRSARSGKKMQTAGAHGTRLRAVVDHELFVAQHFRRAIITCTISPDSLHESCSKCSGFVLNEKAHSLCAAEAPPTGLLCSCMVPAESPPGDGLIPRPAQAMRTLGGIWTGLANMVVAVPGLRGPLIKTSQRFVMTCDTGKDDSIVSWLHDHAIKNYGHLLQLSRTYPCGQGQMLANQATVTLRNSTGRAASDVYSSVVCSVNDAQAEDEPVDVRRGRNAPADLYRSNLAWEQRQNVAGQYISGQYVAGQYLSGQYAARSSSSMGAIAASHTMGYTPLLESTPTLPVALSAPLVPTTTLSVGAPAMMHTAHIAQGIVPPPTSCPSSFAAFQVDDGRVYDTSTTMPVPPDGLISNASAACDPAFPALSPPSQQIAYPVFDEFAGLGASGAGEEGMFSLLPGPLTSAHVQPLPGGGEGCIIPSCVSPAEQFSVPQLTQQPRREAQAPRRRVRGRYVAKYNTPEERERAQAERKRRNRECAMRSNLARKREAEELTQALRLAKLDAIRLGGLEQRLRAENSELRQALHEAACGDFNNFPPSRELHSEK